MRITAGAPHVEPDVFVYAHPVYGDILTDQDGFALYFFLADSAGGDPRFVGSTWPLVDAGISPNVRFKGELKRFIDSKVHEEAGLYGSTSEYIRDLVRRDYEADEIRRWDALKATLEPGLSADDSEFHSIDAAQFLQKARGRRLSEDG